VNALLAQFVTNLVVKVYLSKRGVFIKKLYSRLLMAYFCKFRFVVFIDEEEKEGGCEVYEFRVFILIEFRQD